MSFFTFIDTPPIYIYNDLRGIMDPSPDKQIARKLQILHLLQDQGFMGLDDLAQVMGVSHSTLRRDLQDFIRSGYIRMNTGRVELAAVADEEIPFEFREFINRDEKKRIAHRALELIQNGETIFISGGTTTIELARLLPGQRRLTVITNSLRIANTVVDQAGIELVVLGGKIRPEEQTMHGHLTEWGVQQVRADKLFYGIPAVHSQHGLTHGQMIEVGTDRLIADIVTQVIVLVDHSKFGKIAPALVMPISKVNTIITGREISPEQLESLSAQAVNVILA